jgi:archaellum component FlaC
MKLLKFNQVALFCIFSGIFSYILVDSGLYGKFVQNFSQESVKNSESEFQNHDAINLVTQTTEIKNNLTKFESEFSKEKKDLSSLTEKSESLEKSIQKRKAELALIEEKINQLSNSTSLNPTSDTQRSISPAAHSELTHENIVEQMSQLEKDLNVNTGIPTEVVSFRHGNKEYVRIKTKINYTDTNGVYLSEMGLRQVLQMTRGMRTMGYKNVFLAQNEKSDLTTDRVRSVKSYVKSKYRQKLKVSTLKLSSRIVLDDSFEIWATRGTY